MLAANKCGQNGCKSPVSLKVGVNLTRFRRVENRRLF